MRHTHVRVLYNIEDDAYFRLLNMLNTCGVTIQPMRTKSMQVVRPLQRVYLLCSEVYNAPKETS